MSEEPDMINTTLDNGRSLRQQFTIGVSVFLAFQAIRKSLKYVKFRLTKLKMCFKLVPALHLVNLFHQFST